MDISEQVINKRVEKLTKLKKKQLLSGDNVAYTQTWARLDELKTIQREIEEMKKKILKHK